MIRILDPTLRSPATPVALPRAPRPRRLAGATIGLLANGKSNGMALLDRVASTSASVTRSATSCAWPRPTRARP